MGQIRYFRLQCTLLWGYTLRCLAAVRNQAGANVVAHQIKLLLTMLCPATECCFSSWLLHFPASPSSCFWEGSAKHSEDLEPVTHSKIPGSWLQLNPVLAVAVIQGVNKRIEDFSFPLLLCFSNINVKKSSLYE